MALCRLRERGWVVPDAAIQRGFKHVVRNTGLLGRWQVLADTPLTVADVAHNEDGMRTVVRMLECQAFDRLHIILGMVNDKDIGRVLALLPPTARYYFCKADIPRGLDAAGLAKSAATYGLKGDHHPSVKEALQAALREAGLNDLVLVTGSVFVVAEVV